MSQGRDIELETRAIVIDERDNVATVIGTAKAGDEIPLVGAGAEGTVKVISDIPFGHKVALAQIRAGEQVVKYAHTIGTATADIRAGEHVHVHNMESNRGRGDLAARESE